ncbi:MAG TPA: dihydrofolate reductase family protein [Diaminobutyricibacter sp.]
MRQLFPEVIDPVDPVDVYSDLPVAEGRPSVRLNMISSVDGSTTIKGASGALGSLGDKRVFAVLRSFADVVLVAAGTVRAEHYGPASVPIAVVTRTADLDWQSPFFTEAKARPLVVTDDAAPSGNVERAAKVADVVIAGTDGVDFSRALAELAARGFRHVLAEGGPTLNAELARARLIDELCLTFSPKIVAGDAKKILAGPILPEPIDLSLRSLLEDDGYLFLRYRATSSSR